MTVLVNGWQTSDVRVADRGFQYGDGVFSTALVRRGHPLFFSRHLARLEADCRRLAIPFPDLSLLTVEANSLCRMRREGVLKLQITRGPGGRGYRMPDLAVPTRVLTIHPDPDYPHSLHEKGVEVRICNIRLGSNPALAGIKHMNRLEQILARAEWTDPEIREGLMLDREGGVIEGTMSNIFLIKDGMFATPKLDLCGVTGIMRALVMEGASEQGRQVVERRMGLEEVREADELFLTNSVIGIWPIRRIGSRDYPVGPLTRKLMQWLAVRVQEESAAA